MIKSIKTVMRQEKEKYKVPCKAQDIIPVQRIWWLPTRNSLLSGCLYIEIYGLHILYAVFRKLKLLKVAKILSKHFVPY